MVALEMSAYPTLASLARVVSLAVMVLALASCTTNHPRLVLPRHPIVEVDAATGQRTIAYSPMFLLGAISQANVPVYLHFEGVALEEGSEIDIYLYRPQGVRADENFVGTMEVPNARRIVTIEVRDFEHKGRKHTARTVLRGSAGFGLLLAVRRGGVTIDRVTLTTSPKP